MRFLIGILSVLCIGCASKNTVVSEVALNSLKNAVYNDDIEFVGRIASPLRIRNDINAYNHLPPGSNQAQINLANISNYVRIFQDSISIDLPFYGEQRIINTYADADNSYEFNQKINEKEIVFDAKKKTYMLKLWVKGEEESLRINYTLHANNTAQMIVNSTHRNAITYRGEWTIIKD